MNRSFLFACYRSCRGELLKQWESDYLQRSITVSCKQTILQIGGLGWENQFIDCSLYKNYIILDPHRLGFADAKKIQADSCQLPFKCDSVDMILLPHALEFDADHLHTMREVERVLKPEGMVVILNFNPWNYWINYQKFWKCSHHDRFKGHLIRRSRLLDWLKLLNFEVMLLTEFNFNSVVSTHGHQFARRYSITASAYAIKAIKRRYNVIPLTPVKQSSPRLALVNPINSSTQLN